MSSCGGKILCPFIGVRLTEEYPCCLCAFFLAQMERNATQCELIFLRQRFHLERLNATLFVSFTNSSITGVSTCHERQGQVTFLGLQHFTVEPGCVLSVAGITFVSAFNPSVRHKLEFVRPKLELLKCLTISEPRQSV